MSLRLNCGLSAGNTSIMVRQSTPPPVPTVIVTRPAPGDARFAALLPGLRVICAPILAPHFPPVTLPEGLAGLILTSAHAVTALRPHAATLPPRAWCVGAATAAAAAGLGLHTQHPTGRGDAEALLALILAARPAGPLLHACGVETRGNLAARLTEAGIATQSLTVYDQVPQPLSAPAIAALHGPDPVILPVFSPRSAQLLAAELVRVRPRAPIWLVAISEAAAAPLAGQVARQVTARSPDAAAMAEGVRGLATRFLAASADCADAWVEPAPRNDYRDPKDRVGEGNDEDG